MFFWQRTGTGEIGSHGVLQALQQKVVGEPAARLASRQRPSSGLVICSAICSSCRMTRDGGAGSSFGNAKMRMRITCRLLSFTNCCTSLLRKNTAAAVMPKLSK